MKRRIILFGICLLLCLSGCSKKTQEETIPESKYKLADKTYYNTYDEFGNAEHSNVWFGRDGSYVLRDNYFDGTVETTGKWAISENVCALVSDNDSSNKVIFEIKDDNTLVLKTTLAGSKSGQTFTSDLSKISSNNDNDDPEKIIFLNASQLVRGSNDASFLELLDEEHFRLVEVYGMGATEVNGLYSEMGSVLAFSNFDTRFYDHNGNEVMNFEMMIHDDNTLELMEDFEGSLAGDCFSLDGKVPSSFVPSVTPSKNYSLRFVHEPIDDVSEMYLPAVEFTSDDMFVFTENLYAGMGKYYGHFIINGDIYECYVDDKSELQGFAGYDVDYFEFRIVDDGTIILKNDLCMSGKGDIFKIY